MKLDKLEEILTNALAEVNIRSRMLEKLAGKCTSIPMAVPVAALYTHHMQGGCALSVYGGTKLNTDIAVTKNSGLSYDLCMWLEVRKRFNGASWYKAKHKMVFLDRCI